MPTLAPVVPSSTAELPGSPEAQSTTVIWGQKTSTVMQTVDVTVTACPESVTACPAATTWVTESGYSAPASGWESGGASQSWSYAPLSSATPSSSCQLPSTPLTNEQQVGNSLWGTLCQKAFPRWLDGQNGEKYETAPWGEKNVHSSDATVKGDIPDTGVTRYYEFTISRSEISADGVLRDVILVNNQYPGPLIEANWGDMIQVTVHNNITDPMEGTSLHWHGMLQKNTPWQDGVPSIGQCPIAPGHSFTYKYQAELYGTSWYHAHYSAQYTGGAVGPMQIYGPASSYYDIDLGPIMLTDWYHIPYFSVVADAVGTNLSVIPPTSDNILINGRSNFDCSKASYSNSTEWLGSNLRSNISWTCVDNAEISKFWFQSGKKHLLRLIHHGADGIMKFQIDGHSMTVIAEDYVPIIPRQANVITLGVGQRADVIVTADKDSKGAYYMRTSAPGGAACGGSDTPQALAAIYYEDADTSVMPTSTMAYNSTVCRNDALSSSTPAFSITPSTNPYQQDLEMDLVMNSTGNYEWQINGQTFRANFNEPILYKAAAGNVSYPYDPQWNVYNFDKNHSVVLNLTNGSPQAHPYHLHGHNFYVLHEGTGTWDGTVTNPDNPMRRDIQIVPAHGHVAFQFEADNPGVWPFHCHVAWHLSGGLAMNVVSRPEDIPAIPADMYSQTCTDWDWYSNHNVVDQIDAGS